MWIEADPERSARVKQARMVMSRRWDEKSEAVLVNAGDDFDLKKAKELAHHYRWRAAKIAPRDYGDRQMTELSGPDGGAIKFEGTESELDAKILALSRQLGYLKEEGK